MKTLCRSTLICKQSFAVGSDKSRRLTADQVRELFRNLHDEESENRLDDSDFSSNESRSRVIIQKVKGESRSSDMDFDDRGGALPRPGRSSLYFFYIWRK